MAEIKSKRRISNKFHAHCSLRMILPIVFGAAKWESFITTFLILNVQDCTVSRMLVMNRRYCILKYKNQTTNVGAIAKKSCCDT